MSEADFESYASDCIRDFAIELTRIRELTAEEALLEAQKAFRKSLPDGYRTQNIHLLDILKGEVRIGYFRFEIRDTGGARQAFGWDLKVAPEYAGHGLSAMRLARQHLKELGCRKLSLHVFAKNERAFKLYQAVGFGIDSYNMSLDL